MFGDNESTKQWHHWSDRGEASIWMKNLLIDIMREEILHPYACLTPIRPVVPLFCWFIVTKHKDIYGLTLSQVNPRPQRGIHNFNITDKMILINWNDHVLQTLLTMINMCFRPFQILSWTVWATTGGDEPLSLTWILSVTDTAVLGVVVLVIIFIISKISAISRTLAAIQLAQAVQSYIDVIPTEKSLSTEKPLMCPPPPQYDYHLFGIIVIGLLTMLFIAYK